MTDERISPFQRQSLLGIETIGITGKNVRSPLGFIQNGDLPCVQTRMDPIKVRRILRIAKGKIVPCDTGNSHSINYSEFIYGLRR